MRTKKLSILMLSFFTLLFYGTCSEAVTKTRQKESDVKLKFTCDGKETIFRLYDNPTAKDLTLLCPITLKWEDYNHTEKIAYLPKKLTSLESPGAYTPRAGDLTLYAPWGNLAVFYRNFRSSSGLIPLGHTEDGLEYISSWADGTEITIEICE